jgi:hypothetical protein
MMPENARKKRFHALSPRLAIWIAAALLAGCVASEEPTEEPGPGPNDPPRKRIFASSLQVTGNLGGLVGADALCASWAQAANLGGTWKAFLSATGVSGVNAKDRIAEVGPWYNVNRTTKIFNNKTAFTVGALAAIRTETGGSASGNAWTGTTDQGNADAVNCLNWTQGGGTAYASVGSPSTTLSEGPKWMAKGGNAPACSTPARLYCIEQ